MQDNFPQFFSIKKLKIAINESFDNFITKYGTSLEKINDIILQPLNFIENLLISLPWWSVLITIFIISYLSSKKDILFAITITTCFFIIGVLGLWEESMQSLALMIIAVLLCIIIGLPLGILLSYSGKLNRILLPILDTMQTLPPFVYLIPVIMLFSIGKVPALIATCIYALPPIIRLTDLGLKLINKDLIEASESFGATKLQTLIYVKIPLSIPNIMAGINQTTMMAIAMVVIASMVGAPGLGAEILAGINRLDIGKGLLAGLAIVILAYSLDRICQKIGNNLNKNVRSN